MFVSQTSRSSPRITRGIASTRCRSSYGTKMNTMANGKTCDHLFERETWAWFIAPKIGLVILVEPFLVVPNIRSARRSTSGDWSFGLVTGIFNTLQLSLWKTDYSVLCFNIFIITLLNFCNSASKIDLDLKKLIISKYLQNTKKFVQYLRRLISFYTHFRSYLFFFYESEHMFNYSWDDIISYRNHLANVQDACLSHYMFWPIIY